MKQYLLSVGALIVFLFMGYAISDSHASNAVYKALNVRGIIEAEKQLPSVAPFNPTQEYVVTVQPTPLSTSISRAILVGPDGAYVSALVSPEILAGTRVKLFRYVDFGSYGKNISVALIAEPTSIVRPANAGEQERN